MPFINCLSNFNDLIGGPPRVCPKIFSTATFSQVSSIPEDEVYFSVASFVARTHGKIWMLSTPTRQSGFFYNYWHDKSADWHRVLSTVDDCPEISQAFLDLHRKGAPDDFRREFYCEFTQPAGRLTTRERVRACYNPALSARKLPSLKL